MIESDLEEEQAIECLCYLKTSRGCIHEGRKQADAEWLNRINEASRVIEELLELRGIHQSEQRDRVNRILGLSDW